MTVSGIAAIIIFIYWFSMFIIHLHGLKLVPRLPLVKRNESTEPFVSIVIAAKDEEASIVQTMKSILGQDYKHFELIVVNDRSTDRTGEYIERFKKETEKQMDGPDIKSVHIGELPPGWLGKNYALYQGYLRSRGDYILFTDADVQFIPFTIRSAIAYVQEYQLDHLTAMPHLAGRSFWLRGFIHFFVFALRK
jgi:glycosyltransferase involved in cell wall biosynthesis